MNRLTGMRMDSSLVGVSTASWVQGLRYPPIYGGAVATRNRREPRGAF